MDYYRTHMQAAEPYEESQQDESPSEPSPEVMKAYYQEMERKETLERKLSKRKSGSGTSIWSRKSLKRSNTTNTTNPVSLPPTRTASFNGDATGSVNKSEGGKHEQIERSNSVYQLRSSKSVIPETTKDMPASSKDTWTSVPLPTYKIRYHIHNPLGPRWYKNYHLIPPSQIKPGMRPPSFFSPSFPPISTSSMPDHVCDLGINGDSSRTPSHSPLPTPTSSQTRVGDGGKPRSRKTSQTTPDNVDLLDVTDPWGTNWHHESPYDIGQPTTSNIDLDGHGIRTRRASMTTAQSKHKSLTPSPLSQSSSAVHLQPPDSAIIHLPRKLSKRRTPGLDSVFAPQVKENDRKVVSAPVTPIERIRLSDPTPPDPTSLPKRMSVAPPVGHPLSLQPQVTSTSKKEKRGSVLGRLVKKFSILKKPSESYDRDREYSWHHVNSDDLNSTRNDKSFDMGRRQPPPEKLEGIKRIPVPLAYHPAIFGTPEKGRLPPVDRSSSISLETPFSIGKLTIANPDSPESEKGTPASLDAPLLPVKPREAYTSHHPPPLDQIITHEAQLNHLYEKPLPIPSTPSTSPSSTPLLPPQTTLEEEHMDLPTRSQTVSSTATRTTVIPKNSLTEPRAKKMSIIEQTSLPAPQDFPNDPDSPISSRTDDKHELSTAPVSGSQVESVPVQRKDAGLEQSLRASPQSPQSEIHAVPALNAQLSSPTAAVPLSVTPVAQSQSPLEMTAQERIHSYLFYSDSPYSASSVLANPPTPYNDRATIPLTPEPSFPPELPAKPPKDSKRMSRDPSPSRTRQTETFKLVRNLSGNVYASSETIVAAGQQWEVVESNEAKAKTRSSSKKEREHSKRESKSESKHRSDESADVETRQRSRSHRYSKHSSQEISTIPMPKAPARNPSSRQIDDSRYQDDHHRHDERRRQEEIRRQEETRRQEELRQEEIRRKEERRQEEQKRVDDQRRNEDYRRQEERRRLDEQRRHEERKRQEDQRRRDDSWRQDGYRHHDQPNRRDDKRHSADHRSSRRREDRKSDQKHSGSSTSESYTSQLIPLQAPVPSQPEASPLERRPSTSVRPTSELPSAAELNALRATEAWEMERLWKARSMYGADLGGAVHSIPAASSSNLSDEVSTQGATYGSSHTAFLVQTPFQTPASHIYHSMPSKPPPIIYPSPGSIPSIHDSLSSYDPYDRNSFRQPFPPANYIMTPSDISSLSRPPLANPLPEPPRESSFKPAPLTSVKPSNGRSGEYWTPYAGVTAAY